MSQLCKVMLIVVVCLAVLIPVAAQDDTSAAADAYRAYFIQVVDSAAFIDNGDDTYTIALNNAPSFTGWVTNSAPAALGHTSTVGVAETLNVLSASSPVLASLRTDVVLLPVSITQAAYDVTSGGLTYTFTLADPDGEKLELPDALAETTLIIELSAPQVAEMQTVLETLGLGTRNDCQLTEFEFEGGPTLDLCVVNYLPPVSAIPSATEPQLEFATPSSP